MSSLKSLLYHFGAPLLRKWLSGSMTSKRIKGSSKVLYYDRSQHLGFLFSQEIVYEPEFSHILLDQIQPGTLVFEIGSNIGQYSLQISEKLGPSGKLICVEPDSDNFASLSFNILKNHCQNVELINKAVTDHEDKLTFYKDTTTGGRMSSLIREYSGTHFQGKSEIVLTTTFKAMSEQFGIPAFVKVDVEGAENLIFKEKDAFHHATIFLVEVREETKTDVFNVFNDAGFSLYLLENNQQRILHSSDIPDFANLLIKHSHRTG